MAVAVIQLHPMYFLVLAPTMPLAVWKHALTWCTALPAALLECPATPGLGLRPHPAHPSPVTRSSTAPTWPFLPPLTRLPSCVPPILAAGVCRHGGRGAGGRPGGCDSPERGLCRPARHPQRRAAAGKDQHHCGPARGTGGPLLCVSRVPLAVNLVAWSGKAGGPLSLREYGPVVVGWHVGGPLLCARFGRPGCGLGTLGPLFCVSMSPWLWAGNSAFLLCVNTASGRGLVELGLCPAMLGCCRGGVLQC